MNWKRHNKNARKQTCQKLQMYRLQPFFDRLVTSGESGFITTLLAEKVDAQPAGNVAIVHQDDFDGWIIV